MCRCGGLRSRSDFIELVVEGKATHRPQLVTTGCRQAASAEERGYKVCYGVW